MTTRSEFTGICQADLTGTPDTGDTDALLRRCYPFLIALAKKRLSYAALHDPAVGHDDLTQEAAGHVFAHLAEFDPARGSFRAFLAQQVDRAASILHQRTAAKKRTQPKRATARRTRSHDGRLSTVADTTRPKPPETASERELVCEVWERVAKIVSPRELDVLRLRFAEGLEFENIARLLDVGRGCAWLLCDSGLAKVRREADGLRAVFGL